MLQSTKLLVFFSILIITSGLGLVFVGLKPSTVENVQLTPSAIINTTQPESTDSAVIGIEGQKVLITKVVDGDTFEVEGGRKVRILGVDTPETVDPRKAVECFGKEASSKTKSLLDGKTVILQKDISETDKYGRLLRYVFLPLENGQILFVDDFLIREGFAKVLTIPPDVKYSEQFLEAQGEAREEKRGLWGRCIG